MNSERTVQNAVTLYKYVCKLHLQFIIHIHMYFIRELFPGVPKFTFLSLRIFTGFESTY